MITTNWRDWTVDDATSELESTQLQYQAVKENGCEERDAHLTTLLQKARDENDRHREKAVENILRLESIKKFHAEIGWNYKPKQEAFFKVKRQTGEGLWEEFFEEDDIVKVCAEDNKKKYTKAFDTALMTPEWQDKLGRTGDTEFAKRVL